MGRGRAKAKQTKVARELKYRSVNTDFSQLEEELRGYSGADIPDEYADDNHDDPYAELAAQYNVDDEDDDGYSLRKTS
ncbi:DUF3073 domain-containing protein [Enemella sp. A6]|uniref:DUF3073 domain-containing protein n=1 Tax=Enemella sp. A6 TaxID=3440152 RepID=UPI003EBB6D20